MPRPRSELAALDRRINLLFTYGKTLEPGREEKAELAKYICVLISGLLEASIRENVSQLVARTKPHRRIGAICISHTDRVTSLNKNNLVSFLSAIDGTIASNINTSDKISTSALNSIVSNRHNIAHGRDSQISLSQIEEYYAHIKPLLNEINKLSQA